MLRQQSPFRQMQSVVGGRRQCVLAVAMQADRLRRDRCPSPVILLTLPCCTISNVCASAVLRFQSTRLTGFAAPASRQLITAIGKHFLARCQAILLA